MTEEKWQLIIHPAACIRPIAFKEYEFGTYKEALAASNTCADLLIFIQDEMAIMPDCMNIFVICKLVDGEWLDVEEIDLEVDPPTNS